MIDKQESTRCARGLGNGRIQRRKDRTGAILVWTSILLVVLLGMTGLVIDGGRLMSAKRHAQNAADAAAMAAAMGRLRGKQVIDAIADGEAYVQDAAMNNLPDATVTINNPPVSGPYADNSAYFEAIVAVPHPTFFIHVLPGVANGTTATARAVAGWEVVAAGEGMIALNPNAEPGVKISGGGNLVVEGDVIVNSLGGGVDEDGNAVEGDHDGMVATNNSTVMADNILVAGGVNEPDNFNDINEGEEALDAGTGIEYPDPFIDLPTPSVANGVVNVRRGSPQATNQQLKLNNNSDSSGSPNFIENPGSQTRTMVLKPGIYDSITITGGRVRFEPGIYVLAPPHNVQSVLTVTGGTITANSVMFYSTGTDYDPVTGAPDNADLGAPPPADFGTHFGKITINAGVGLHPLDYDSYANTYPTADIVAFDGFLFYHRRWNTETTRIQGNSDTGDLTGTYYAKWGTVNLAGQGTYDAQFAVGQFDITGGGDITLTFDGDAVGKAPRVFLVE